MFGIRFYIILKLPETRMEDFLIKVRPIDPNFHFYVLFGSLVEGLERSIAVREVSGSISGRGGHKNLCGLREPSEYVSSIHLIHTITRQDQHNNTLTNALYIGTGSRSVPSRCRSLISSRMTYNVVCCISEKKCPSTRNTWPPL